MVPYKMFLSKLEQRFSAAMVRVALQCFVVGMVCFGASSVYASDKLSTEKFSKFDFKKPNMDMNSDIYVNADRITARYEGVSELVGNVVMTFSDITMLCDRATYNHKTGDVEASGDVEITSKSGGSWRGDSIAFNHKTGYGLIGTGLLRLGQFAVLADSIARDEDGVAYARNATITSCSNEMDSWHWSITGEGRFKQKEFLELRDAVGRLWGIPVMWFPYYYRDLNTHYGWRFMPGYTSKWGAYVLTGYVYPIAGSIEDDGLLYGKTIVDLRSEYGVAAGQELTWQTLGGFLGDDVIQRGYISAYVARHSSDAVEDEISGHPEDWHSPLDEYRYSIGLSERVDFTPRDHLSIEAEYVSDTDFRSDYKETSVRKVSEPVGLVNYEHRENEWVASLATGGPLNSFYAGTRRLPEFRLDTLPKNVFNIPKLYYESQTSVGWFERQAAKTPQSRKGRFSYKPGNWAYYESARLDTRHIFRRPFTLFDGVTLTPRVGWRGTYYSDAPMQEDYFRSLFELGTTLQARYWKDFEKYRHTVIPYLDFTYVPGSQTAVEDIPYSFDRLDQAYEWRDRFASDGMAPTHPYTGLRFGVRNLVQRRSKENVLTRYFNFDLYGIFVAQTDDHWVRWTGRQQPGRDNLSKKAVRVKEETGMRVLGFDAIFSPTRNLDILTDFQYDPTDGRVAFWDVGLRTRVSSLTLYAGCLTRNHELYDYYWSDTIKDTVVYGGFAHELCDTVEWSMYARYNIEFEDLEEIGGYLQYNLDCISFRLTTEYTPLYFSEDGYKNDPDFKISLGAWLRAFPMSDGDDWKTWGNFVHMKRLQPVKE